MLQRRIRDLGKAKDTTDRWTAGYKIVNQRSIKFKAGLSRLKRNELSASGRGKTDNTCSTETKSNEKAPEAETSYWRITNTLATHRCEREKPNDILSLSWRIVNNHDSWRLFWPLAVRISQHLVEPTSKKGCITPTPTLKKKKSPKAIHGGCGVFISFSWTTKHAIHLVQKKKNHRKRYMRSFIT